MTYSAMKCEIKVIQVSRLQGASGASGSTVMEDFFAFIAFCNGFSVGSSTKIKDMIDRMCLLWGLKFKVANLYFAILDSNAYHFECCL